MRKEPEKKIDPKEPALIVLAGQTRNRRRPLDGDVFMLGRAPGCDLGLVSAEVAPVHCVILRLSRGWRIRDCSGRGATRLNGQPIREASLRDGDIIQVGSFSFEAFLPKSTALRERTDDLPTASPAEQALRKKRERSRRNLARHALRLRARLRANAEAEEELAQRQEDLERQEERLRYRIREQEAKIARMTEERRELDALREELDRMRAEVILSGDPEDVRDMEEQVRELERWGVQLVRQNAELDQRTVELDRRAAELNLFARALLRKRKPQAAPVVETPRVEERCAEEPEKTPPEDVIDGSNDNVVLPPTDAPEGNVSCV
jgi:pSer/pThr/pTyr-binding forkhead associated (FHA) protein